MTSVAVSPSRLIRTWSPWVSITEAKVTCGRSRRSASIAGTTLIAPSVEAMPHTTRSTGVSAPAFSIALASTSDVATGVRAGDRVVDHVHALVGTHLQRLADRVDGLLGTHRQTR